ncbi:MAG TPA: NAD(P)/FAD-dependent oxidoreductase [Bryobacteraceae bacterium]|nr:NAD(P)/FAD-dependent oxidoreductase [Bryobacteraceae bacterium]
MPTESRKVLIIGGGIAGLCAAVYARQSGYQAEVLEMNDVPGGLAMSWRRGAYTFETCLHWLAGSRSGGEFHNYWQELFDISQLRFVDPDEMIRIENEQGDSLSMSTDLNRLEATLLERAPADAKSIRAFIGAARRLAGFRLFLTGQGWAVNTAVLFHDLPIFFTLGRLNKITCEQYGARFQDPLLRAFFGSGELGRLSAIALVWSLAWMSDRNAGYAIGGAQSIIRPIERRIHELGGAIRYGARVVRILVENGAAVGVQLDGGETLHGDWVISAADGHATLNDMLGGAFTSPRLKAAYENNPLFPSYLQVSLGVAMDLGHLPHHLTRILDSRLYVDPQATLDRLAFRFFHFDPTFAPPGKTAVTCFLPTGNYVYWRDLRKNDFRAYCSEKHRVAEAVIEVLERRVPGIRAAIETVDVSTPATVLRYTGNWKGSMEGWLLAPGVGLRALPNKLPGLRRFRMVGQWVSPGGGLPCGPITARAAVEDICREDRVRFTPGGP